VGAEGTLGIVTRAELQLERAPAAVGTLVVALPSLDALGDAVSILRRFDPVAIELLDRTFLDLAGEGCAPFPLAGVRAVLLTDVEGPEPRVVAAALDRAERAVAVLAVATRTGLVAAERRALWEIRHAASPALAALPDERRSFQVIEDGCVPVPALGRYVAGIERAAADAGIPVVLFGHAGDGHVHVNALVDTGQADFERRLARLFDDVSGLVVELGGTPAGEHGDGRIRTPLLDRLYGPDITRLFGAVKRAFDPEGILNPGVIVPDGAAAPALKAGPAAPAIPADVAAALRRRERGARWDQDPLTLLDGPA
jgi:FAD/FMN-containing dehydrogenase